MARIYDAFNALGLGQAINGLHNGIAAQKANGLQALGDSVQNYLMAMAEEKKEAAQRKSALDYLMGRGGVDEREAEGLVGSIGAPDAVKYIAGKNDEQEIYSRNRKDLIDDRDVQWKHELEDWTKKNDITYRQAVKQAQFGQLMQQLGLITSKDWGNSRKGVDQYNDTINALQTFAKENPEFMDVLGLVKPDIANKDNFGYYDEDILNELRKFGSKDYSDDDRESLLKRLIEHDKFNYIIGNPTFQDAILTFGANVDKKNLMKQVNLQRLLGNTVTQTQRNKQRESANFNKRIETLYDAIIKAASGKGEFPKLDNSELKALEKKFGKNQRFLRYYRRGK